MSGEDRRPTNRPAGASSLGPLQGATEVAESTLREWTEERERFADFLASHASIDVISTPVRDMPLRTSPSISTNYIRRSLMSSVTEPLNHSHLPQQVPSLTTGRSVVDSDAISIIESRYDDSRLSESDGRLFPLTPVLATGLKCVFHFLDCHETFDFNAEEHWKTHCTVHFRSITPPRTSSCNYCSETWVSTDGFDSWNRKLDHTLNAHLRANPYASPRPDFDLFVFLFNKRIISNSLYQELTESQGVLGVESVWAETHRPPRLSSRQ
jgi:hypothetical protein